MIEFNRVLSPLLDDNKYWYTLNPDLCDTVPRTFASYNVFKVLKEVEDIVIDMATSLNYEIFRKIT